MLKGKGGLVVGAIIIKDNKILLVKHNEKASQKTGTYGYLQEGLNQRKIY